METKRLKIEKIFIFIALAAGLFLLMVEPPITGADERVHFLNAYGVATGQVIPKLFEGELTRAFPKNLVDFTNEREQRYVDALETKANFTEWYFDSWMEDRNTETVRMTYWGVDTHPFGYLISGFGMAIYNALGNLFDSGLVKAYNLLMIGKLFNLFFYVLIMYFALKWIPVYKRVLFLIALMPMSIYQAASLNYDAILLPSCFLLIAIVLQLLSNSEISVNKKHIMLILCLTAMLAGVKQVYAALLVLLFAIRKKQFKSTRQYVCCILSVATVFLVVYGGQRLLISAIGAGPNSNMLLMNEQAAFVQAHPLKFFQAMIISVSKYFSFYRTGFFGILGQLDTNFPIVFQMLFYTVLLGVVIYDSLNNGIITIKLKILSGIAILMTVVASFAAMYITWTSLQQGIGVNFVDGIQGRYFIPLFPLFALLFATFRKSAVLCTPKVQCMTDELTIFTGIMSASLTVCLIMMRYWF